MTGIIDDAFAVSDPANNEAEQAVTQITESAALLEQAKGVLIFRYGIDACAAFSLIELWSAEAGVGIEAVAHAVVHEICQGDQSEPSDPQLVRWLQERLRQEFPGGAHAGT